MKGLTSPVWTLGILASVWNEPNRERLAILQFGIQHVQWQDVDLPNIRTLPICRITMSRLELITKNLQIDWHQCSLSTDKRGWDLQEMGGLFCLVHLSILLSHQTRSPAVTSSLSSVSMSKKDDELNDFVDEVTDREYNLPCLEVIMKLVNRYSHGESRESRTYWLHLLPKEWRFPSSLICGTRICTHEHTFYNTLFRIPVKKTYFLRMRARCSCKTPSILHPILWFLIFIRWSTGFKWPRSRTFTPYRGRLFPYVKHLRKMSWQRRWNSFWRSGHRWWRTSINISI